MRKHLLASVFLAAALAAPGTATAQNCTVYDFQDCMFSYDGTQTCMYGQFNHVSANGKYAVGYDEEFVPMAYMWFADEPAVLKQLSDGSLRISACDVSNDGTVVGSWEETAAGEEEGICYPAYKTLDGEWTKLPVPENYSEYDAKNQLFVNEVRAVTPDGRFMAGNLKLVVGYNEKFGFDIRYQIPVLWENGEIKQVYNLDGIKTFQVWDISDDGSIIVGMNTAECGGFNPAIIKDGKLINILQCDSENEDEVNFNGGNASSIDKDGNVYGYFQEADGVTIKHFIYNSATGDIKYVDDFVTCGTTGVTFSQGDPLPYTLDCSDDGRVVVGATGVSTGLGMGVCPQVAVYDKVPSAIARPANAGDVSVNWRGGDLTVSGDYDRACVYNAAGALVAGGAQGSALGMAAAAKGTYIIKVATAQGVKSFKIMK